MGFPIIPNYPIRSDYMEEKKSQEGKIFDFLKTPNILGGPPEYNNIRFKNNYLEKYNKYIRENKVIPFKVYHDESHDEFYYHFQITSEHNKEVIYDVVIKFFSDNKFKHDESLDNYDFQIFSNSPGFVFQFSYVYNKYKLLIPEFKDHFVEGSLEIEPTRSNPKKALGYDYTIYFAIYHLALNHFYITKREISRIGRPIREFKIGDVLSTEVVLNKRNPQDLLNINKIKKTITRTIIDKPKDAITDILRKVGLTKPTKARKSSRATKARRGTKARKM